MPHPSHPGGRRKARPLPARPVCRLRNHTGPGPGGHVSAGRRGQAAARAGGTGGAGAGDCTAAAGRAGVQVSRGRARDVWCALGRRGAGAHSEAAAGPSHSRDRTQSLSQGSRCRAEGQERMPGCSASWQLEVRQRTSVQMNAQPRGQPTAALVLRALSGCASGPQAAAGRCAAPSGTAGALKRRVAAGQHTLPFHHIPRLHPHRELLAPATSHALSACRRQPHAHHLWPRCPRSACSPRLMPPSLPLQAR